MNMQSLLGRDGGMFDENAVVKAINLFMSSIGVEGISMWFSRIFDLLNG